MDCLDSWMYTAGQHGCSCQCRTDIASYKRILWKPRSLLCILTATQSIYLMLQLGFWHRDAHKHPFSVLYVAALIDTVSSVTCRSLGLFKKNYVYCARMDTTNILSLGTTKWTALSSPTYAFMIRAAASPYFAGQSCRAMMIVVPWPNFTKRYIAVSSPRFPWFPPEDE